MKPLIPTEKIRRRINLNRLLVIGFFLIIITGAILLMLPISSADGTWTPFSDTMFTATSATCITGLVVYDTATHWSFFGQAVILTMIQVGGLGFMTLGSAVLMVLRKRSINNRKQIAESLNTSNYHTSRRMLRHVLTGTAAFEGAGAIILSFRFIPEYGLLQGIWKGLFLSVSAFCNAGFDLFGTTETPFASVTAYADDTVVNLTVMGLIVIGGLGFLVWEELYTRRSPKNFSLFTKTVLLGTVGLILFGAIGICSLEWSNPETLGALGPKAKVFASFFQSISPRTAGLNTIDLAAMTESTQVLQILLMFVGAASGSTGGGVKITTVAVLFAALKSVATGKSDATLFKRRISSETVYRAFALVFFPLVAILLCTFAVDVAEPSISWLQALFECTSAFGTVGLSLSVTPTLSLFSKLLLMLLMFAGRVGMLTISFAFLSKRHKQNTLRCPEGNILIG